MIASRMLPNQLEDDTLETIHDRIKDVESSWTPEMRKRRKALGRARRHQLYQLLGFSALKACG